MEAKRSKGESAVAVAVVLLTPIIWAIMFVAFVGMYVSFRVAELVARLFGQTGEQG